MERREHFEQFAQKLAMRRRRAEVMSRSLQRRAADRLAAGESTLSTLAPPRAASFDAAADVGERPGDARDDQMGAVLFAEAVALADATIEELSDAEAELVQQNEALFEAQLQLDETSRHYRSLFELAPAAYVVTTEDGVIREINETGSALLGRPRNFAAGKPLALFVAAGEERAAFRTALARLRGARDVQVWRMRLAPSTRPAADVIVSVRRVRDARGKRAWLYWLLRDETDRADDDLL